MAMTEAQFIELEGNINETWDAYFSKKDDYIPELFNVITDECSQFTDYTIGAPSRMHKWNGSVQYDNIVEGYPKQYRADKYDNGVQVERDLWEDKEYRKIKQRVTNLAIGVDKTMRYESADIFNNAFSTTLYSGPDSAALCSASHKTVPGASNQNNAGSSDLNYESYEDTVNAMEQWEDDKGDPMLVEGTIVIAGPYWRKTCTQLFGSEKEAYTADNQKNVYKGVKYFIHPLIRGKKWFVANEDLMKNGSGLNFFLRRDPRNIERDGDVAKGDFNTEMLSWKVVGRWVKGWTNWFFIYGHNP